MTALVLTLNAIISILYSLPYNAPSMHLIVVTSGFDLGMMVVLYLWRRK